jgi:hypothetical protein
MNMKTGPGRAHYPQSPLEAIKTSTHSSANHTGAILPISFAACELVAVKAVPKISLS